MSFVLSASDVTCTACGCLCDDITVNGMSDAWTTENACQHGEAWFQSAAAKPPCEALIGGHPVTLEEGINHAARILVSARLPLVFGLADLTIDAQRRAVALADELGGCVAAAGPAALDDVLFPSVGDAGCTWGEVRDRADLVVYWNCDPAKTHWRHEERVLEPARRSRCLRVLHVDPTDDFLAAWSLRSWLRGRLDRVGDELAPLAAAISTCGYGVVVHDGSRPLAPLRALVGDLNRRARFRLMDLGRPGNAAGERAVLCWQTGYARGVGLHRGYPVSFGREFTADSLLSRGEADAALWTGRASSLLAPPARLGLANLPSIAILSGQSLPTPLPSVALFANTAELHGDWRCFRPHNVGHAVMRSDGLTLPLRLVFLSSFPPADMVIKRLAEVVQKQRATTDG